MLQNWVDVTHILIYLTAIRGIYGAPTASTPSTYVPSGKEKNAWPELLNTNVNDAITSLNASGFVQNIFVQPPSSGTTPTNVGKTTDVWLYTDGSSVYETPRRASWHANRLIPGWPEVTGMYYKAAISKITTDILGVTVIYGPQGFVRTGDLRMDRVWLDLNSDGTVAGVPSIG